MKKEPGASGPKGAPETAGAGAAPSAERGTFPTVDTTAPGAGAASPATRPGAGASREPPPRGAGDRYTVRGEIARGGMGAIVEVVDNDIQRPVAMKVILGSRDPSQAARFVEEAKVTGQLEHPNIVPVHELGRTGDGKSYFTMKLVRGDSLEAVLERIADRDEESAARFPLPRLLEILLKVCDAVAFAHSRGVIHRDLKPDNVMVGAFGEVLVMDWGLSRVSAGGSPGDPEAPSPVAPAGADPSGGGAAPRGKQPGTKSGGSRTIDGQVMGTPSYMPPEQAAGRVAEVDARSDVFALGGILYRILAQEPPYDGDTAEEVLRRAAGRDLLPPRRRSPFLRVPPELESVCMKAMERAREDRYPSVEALAEDVRAFLEHRLVSAHRYGPFARFVRFVQRHPGGSLAAGVGLILAALGTAGIGTVWAEARTQAARARAQEARAAEERARADAQTARADEQKARAEAQVLRAAQAERDRAEAQARATQAEDSLVKGRTVARILRSAEKEIGPLLRELRNSFLSRTPPVEKLAAVEKRWGEVERFCRSAGEDRAAQAVTLALRGWIRALGWDTAGARDFFRRSEEADPEVAYGLLFQALLLQDSFLATLHWPGYLREGNRLVVSEPPPENPEHRRVAADLETVL
ncbi:MAG: serine/threonine protein kinase, partial [Planctomycetes bacterium]|nr:serine/threonine protein kinase [Planctomycetota bacterium]